VSSVEVLSKGHSGNRENQFGTEDRDRAAIGHWARAEIRSDDKSLKAKSDL